MSEQRIYRGGSQYHEHPAIAHPAPALHDGYWRHYHDEGGQVAVGEETGTQETQGAQAAEVIRCLDQIEAWIKENHPGTMDPEFAESLAALRDLYAPLA